MAPIFLKALFHSDCILFVTLQQISFNTAEKNIYFSDFTDQHLTFRYDFNESKFPAMSNTSKQIRIDALRNKRA